MKSNQWTWIYNRIKSHIDSHTMPDDKTARDLMEFYNTIMSHSTNDRAKSEQMNEELTNIFGYLFKIVHCLELEGKPL